MPFVAALFCMQAMYPILTVILVIMTTNKHLNCPTSKYKFLVTKQVKYVCRILFL